MSHEHFIPGKDASLETSIRTMQERLAALDLHIEERSWLNPVEGIWSVHIRDRDCPLLFTNGKGASRDAALASALGEFFERLGCQYFWSHYYLGELNAAASYTHYPQEQWFPLAEDDDAWPRELLTPELQRFYNPEGTIPAESLVDLNSGNYERGICAIPYVRQHDGVRAYFPVNIIANLYVSNGMSAGNTPNEARAQALSEIFERYVKFRILREGICLPDVPPEVIARFPRIEAGVRALRDAGFGILVKDASLGGSYPVMCVTLLNPHDHGCYASFGAHPRFEIALERALTELLQGRALDALDGFPPPGFDLDEVAHPHNIESHFVDSSGIISWRFLSDAPDFPFVDWNFSNSTTADYHWLVERVHAEGKEIYIADFDHLGVYACRIIVPGMSEIYPIDELEWDNNSVGNDLRDAILNLADLDDDDCTALLETLEERDLDNQKPIAPLIGLAPDAGSFWRELRVGELKTLLALAIGDEAAALEGCQFVNRFGHIAEERARVYRCIEALFNLQDAERFNEALGDLYGSEALALARALLAGKRRFFGHPSPGLALRGCEMHQRLLRAYEKVRRVM